ncbi:MAG: Ig-like domain repeat protein [Candidatus Acidiferrales bacterium]
MGRCIRPTALTLFVLLLAVPKFASAQAGNQRPLITQAVNENKLTRLTGNTHPLARPEFDRGPAPPSLPMQRMLLVLSRSPQQEAALQTLLENQQDRSSPSFHKWLTPNEFGQQFGPSAQDIQTVAAWLASHGFQVARVSNGRDVIEFSGTAEQVQEAFHTSIHSYVINGKQHWANASDPLIPTALAPVVVGVDTLDNFRRKAMHENVRVISKSPQPAPANGITPLLTYQCGTTNSGAPFYCNAVTPFDFATIYNVLPLWNASTPIDGTGQSIAIVGRSNINVQDVSNFRTLFGLPANPPQVILDGPDPGLVPGDETEADLDVEWSGAVARGATIKLVASESTETTDGVDLSALYIVDNDIAPIMSQSFLACELDLGTAGNQFYKSLWQQAAAQGITVMVSSGDQGSAGCDFLQGPAPQPAKNGLEVNGLASTPYNVAVGGTDFNDFSNTGTYWNLNGNSPTQESAKGYIPETTWNDSCTNAIWAQVGFSAGPEGNCNNPQISGSVFAVGGGGGKSNCTTPAGSTAATCSGGYAKPPWQTGTTVPTDGKRDLPDVSLFAADGFIGNFYVICEADILSGSCNNFNFVSIGGTSVSSPAFAGLMALVDQKTAAQQGNPNFIFYKLAAAQSATTCNSSTGPASTCVFNDVTTGTIAMPCSTGSLNCTTSNSGDPYGILSGYNAGVGYDLATGLGSVNAANLVNNWNSVIFKPSTTTLTLNGGNAINITHGAPISVSASVSPTSPQATGDVSLMATQGTNTFGFDTLTLSNGTASGTTSMLPGGTSYTVMAHYAGDGTYGGSDSNAVTVTVNPESSKTGLRLATFDLNTGQITNPNATTLVYGSSYLLRSDVTNSSGTNCFNSTSEVLIYGCPTGTLSLTDNGSPLGPGAFPLNSQGYTEDQSIQLTGGSHTLLASYSGDNSYTASSATDAVTVTPASTTTLSLFNPPLQTVVIGTPFGIDALTKSQSLGAAPTGTYTVFDGTTQLATNSVLGFSGSPSQPASCQGTIEFSVSGASGPHTLTVKYSGDANYSGSTSAAVTVNALYPVTIATAANPTSIIYGNKVTVTATVDTSNPATNAALKPTGTVSFSGNNGQITDPVTSTVTQDSSGNWEIQATVTTAPPNSESIDATYSGDLNYASGTNYSLFINVTTPDFSVSAGTAPLVITAGQTGTATLTVTPASNYTSTVQLSCSKVTPIPGATCSIAPSSVTLSNGAPATAILSLTPLPPSSSLSALTVLVHTHGAAAFPLARGEWWTLSGLTGIVALFLLVLSGGKRPLRPVLAWGLMCLLTFAIGCGGGSGSGNGVGAGGPAVTTTTLTTNSAKFGQGFALVLTANVNSPHVATGNVNFNFGSCLLSLAQPLTNGTSQLPLNTTGFTPGGCTVTAQYSGDINNQPSQSGPINIVVTGDTQQLVDGQTGSVTHEIPVNVTIQ